MTLPDSENASIADIYLGLVDSYVLGMQRYNSSRMTSLALRVVAYRHVANVASGKASDSRGFESLEDIRPDQFEAYEYIGNVSSLVYLTTLFDTFLTDSTKFLLLLFPSSIGSSQSFPIERLIVAKTTAELITDAAAKKARELSFLPFKGRIRFLEEKFGVALNLDQARMDLLDSVAALRNSAIHDEAVADCALEPDGKVVLLRKGRPEGPTSVTETQVRNAESVYMEVVAGVIRHIVQKTLSSPLDPRFLKIDEVLTRWSSSVARTSS